MNPLRLLDRMKYLLERQLIKGVGFQLLVVMFIISLVSLLGGLLVLADQEFANAGESVWWAFLRLTDPGYLGDDEGTWKRVISTLLTVAGYVLFMGTLVAIMTQWLIARWRDLERGLTPVSMKHHIVVLGWSNRTVPLVRELVSTRGRMRRFLQLHGARRMRLVIMDDDITVEQHHTLRRDDVIGSRVSDIVLRSGSPMNIEHLVRASCNTAAAIILPSAFQGPQALVNADVETIKSLLSIRSQTHGGQMPYVVAELQDVRHTGVARRAYPGELEIITGDAYVSRLLAQTIRRPGLSLVYRELMTQSPGQKLYVRHLPALEGKAPSELRRSFRQAVFCGILRVNDDHSSAVLTIDEREVLGEHDHVVLLSGDYRETEPQKPVGPPIPLGKHEWVEKRPFQHRILILGWNRKIPMFLRELTTYANERFVVDVLSTMSPGGREELTRAALDGQTQVTCAHVQADYTLEAELAAQHPESYDRIVLLGSDRVQSGAEADARTMVGYLCLENVLAQHHKRPPIILELNDAYNEALMIHNDSEVILSPILVSHLLAQVALRRELKLVYDELFTAGGPEIVFRHVPEALLNTDVTQQALADQLWQRGDTLLGIYRDAQGEKPASLELKQGAEQRVRLEADMRLVVITY
ncbi:hypothetical protein NFC81_02495 [Salinispirillum sp. LH 10-3-1]|uniref:CASTOR/POLLUX/SYM8 ion channel conserved domain-containing protein n=1 Tax=Salinispirillum sp. LH 10-3-1 TaxID=2952525 RepID=A0AB38YH49_9GAMM